MSGCDNKLAVAMKLKDKDMFHANIISVLYVLFYMPQNNPQKTVP
jgi:hypothetical protein